MSNPFEDYAAQDQQQPTAQQAKQPQPQIAANSDPFESYALQDSQPLQAGTATMEDGSGLPKQGPPGSPDNPFQGIIEYSQKLNEARDLGKTSFRDSVLGNSVLEGRMTFEEAQKQIAADDKTAQLSADLEQYTKDSAIPWLTAISLETVKQLPVIEESLKPFAGGFGVGAAGGAATGIGAVPLGGAVGTAAVGGWTADFVKGQEYLRYRQQGMDHDAAAKASTISGWVQGALAGLQFGNQAKVPVVAAKSALAAHAQNVAHMVAEGARFTAIQTTLAEAQTLTRQITDAIAGTISKTPGVVPTLESATQEFADTFNQTLQSSIGLFVGGKAIGAATGLALKPIVGKAIKAHMENQAAKAEKIKQDDLKARGIEPDQSQPAQAADSSNTQQKSSSAAGSKPPSKNAVEKARRQQDRLDRRIAAEREIRRIFAAAKSRFYTATDETRLQETERIQRIIKRMVKNSDWLDDKTKVKLLGRLTEINGVADLLREGDRFIEEQQGKEYANALQAADDKLKAAIKSGQLKGKKTKLPPEVQQSLKWHEEFFTLPKIEKQPKGSPKRAPGEEARLAREAALKKATDYVQKGIKEETQALNDQVDKLENGELAALFDQPADLAEKQRIAMLAQQYWAGKMDAADIASLADEINQTVKDEKVAFLDKKKASGQKLLNDRAKTLEGVQGIKPVVPSADPNPPKQMNIVGKVLNSMRRNESALWDKLFQDTAPDKRQALTDMLSVTEAENKEHEINRRASEDLKGRYEDAVGDMVEAKRLIMKGADKKQRIGLTFTDADGNSTTEHYTVNQLTYLHMAMQDTGALPGLLKGNKFTLDGMVEEGHTSTQTAVREFLEKHEDGKYIKLGEAVMDHYSWLAPLIGNHYLKEYGVPLKMEDNYSGRIQHRQLEQIKSMGDLLEGVHDMAQRTLDPGSTNERKNSSRPVVLQDPFRQVQSHQSEMAFWIANSEKARQLSFIFSDTSKDGLRDVIEHKLGAEYKNLIDGRLAFQFHLKPGILDIADRPLQDIRGKFSVSILGGFRPDQRVKQLTGVFAPLKTCTWDEWREGVAKCANDKEAVAEYIANSELYRERQEHTVQQMIQVTNNKTFLDSITGNRSFEANTFFMKDMHYGDGVAAKVGGFIEYNRLRNAGLSPKEAALGADRLVDQTQASSRPGQRTPNEFKKGQSALNAAFQKEATQAFNRQAGAVRDAIIHGDKASINRAVRVWTSVVAGQVLFEAINNTPAFLVGDDEDKQRALTRIATASVFGALERLPGLGWDVATIAQGKEPRTMTGAIAGDSAKFFKKAYKVLAAAASGEAEEIEGDDAWTALKAAALAQGWHTGIPIYSTLKYGELAGKLTEKAQGQ
ncbi:MAG: hypothetical protein JST01_14475 [Cyanobacteria bacterium SZAS TMP-1]|nr:hypothetical protein [Cyanobacteria bacterium SZAS TMP-1]